jgi:GMP synthase (glutamine-hydrolysing)
MTGTFILVTHDKDEKDDRASAWLRRQGYRPHWTCPAEGESLPALTDEIAGAVIYGGKQSVAEQEQYPFLKDELRFIDDVLKRDLPFLGLCLGGQLLAHVLGEPVSAHADAHAEYGYYDFLPTAAGRRILGEVPKVLQSHFHGWYATPKGAVALGRSEAFPEQAFRYGDQAYGLQFHPEASRGMLMRWIGNRPPERHALPHAFPAERQLADNLVHDTALGDWFHGFLAQWLSESRARREAAE